MGTVLHERSCWKVKKKINAVVFIWQWLLNTINLMYDNKHFNNIILLEFVICQCWNNNNNNNDNNNINDSNNNIATNTTQTLSSDDLIERERVIEKEKPKQNLVPDGDIIFTLAKLPIILDNDDFEWKQEMKKQDKEINDEIDLTRLNYEIDSREIPKEIEFYFGGPSPIFFKCVQAWI